MNLLEEAFNKNGWSKTEFNADYIHDVYTNPGWPESQILCGGGFSIRGPLLDVANAWSDYERSHDRMGLGSGGDYGQLAVFLNFAGRVEQQF